MRIDRQVISAAVLLIGLLLAAPLAAQEPHSGLYDRPVLALDPGLHTAMINRADVDAAGATAVTGSDDKTLRLWSVADSRLLRTIRVPAGPGNVGKVYAVAISPDGKTLAAGGWTRWTESDPQEQIYLFDAGTGALTGSLDGLPSVVAHLTFSLDGTRLAAALGSGGLRVYGRTAAGGWTEAWRDEAYGDRSNAAAFARDDRLATTSLDGWLRLYDATGQLIGSAETGLQPFGLAFNPADGRLAVGFYGTPEVRLYDGATLEPLPGPDLDGLDNGDLSSVAWSADGARLFAAGRYYEAGGNPVIVWEAGSAGVRRMLPAGSDVVMSLRPLPDDGLLVTAADPWLGAFAPDGALRWEKAPAKIDPRGQRSNLGVSADGMLVDFGLEPWGEARMRFDVAALALLRDPTEDGRTSPPEQEALDVTGWVNGPAPALAGTPLALEEYEISRSLAIAPGGERFLLGADWSLRAFDAQGAELWSRPAPGAVWAVNVAGDGRLAVAAYGDGTLRWHNMEDGAELLALFPFADGKNWVAWEPDGRFAATLGARNALRWVVNQGWDKAPLELRAGQVPLSFRPEVIRRVLPLMGSVQAVYAAEEAERRAAISRLTGGMVPGAQLHVLSVGVDYGGAANPPALKWASADAADIAAALTGQVDWPYAPGLHMTLRNEEARGVDILDQLDRLRQRMAASPDGRDLAVFMFSGHGVLLGEDDAAEYYLLPQDADVQTPARIQRTGVSGTELRTALAGIAAYGRVLVLLDTCNSGAASGEGRAATSLEAQRSLVGKNVTVFASSGALQASRETDGWRNGAFTEVMLEALGKAGDQSGNGMISVGELQEFVARRLPEISDQAPAIETRFTGDLFSSGL